MGPIKALLITLVVIAILDGLWLGVLMTSFYDSEVGELARRQNGKLSPRWAAAIVVYLLIPLGIVLFVRPLLSVNSAWWQAIGWGALYGLVVYGVYDLTNRAVLEQWSLRMTLVDIAWGCTLCGLSTLAIWAARAI